MNVNDLKKSKFLTKNDVMPPVLVTIDHEEEVNVAKEGAEPEYRWALWFRELEKPLILNSTNGQIIAAITGSEESHGWHGHQVVLYNDPNISFGGKLTGGIRVRANETTAPVVPQKLAPKNSTAESFPKDHNLQEQADELMEYNKLPKPNAAEQALIKQICKDGFNDSKCEIKNRIAIWKYLNQSRWPAAADVAELVKGIKMLNECSDEIPF